jgi:nitroreductase
MSETEIPSPEATMALLQGRRSIREYHPDLVPDEMVNQILQAGQWAPSASHRQPWAFIVVRDPGIREQVAADAAYSVVRWAHVGKAPLLIVMCGHRKSPVYRQFLHEDIGLAGGQMMLQAKALGLGTCWIGGLDRKAMTGTLKVPDEWEIVGLLTVGFPAEEPRAPRRKPLADMVHYDVFGNLSPDATPDAGRPPGGMWATIRRRLRFPYRSKRRSQKEKRRDLPFRRPLPGGHLPGRPIADHARTRDSRDCRKGRRPGESFQHWRPRLRTLYGHLWGMPLL